MSFNLNRNSAMMPWQGGFQSNNTNANGRSFFEMPEQPSRNMAPTNNALVSYPTRTNFDNSYNNNNSNNFTSSYGFSQSNANEQKYFSSGNNAEQTYVYNSIGTVSQEAGPWGVVNDDIIFHRSVCRGDLPQIGDRVLFEAIANNTEQRYKWIAKRIQLMTNPSASTSASNSQIPLRKVSAYQGQGNVNSSSWSMQMQAGGGGGGRDNNSGQTNNSYLGPMRGRAGNMITAGQINNNVSHSMQRGSGGGGGGTSGNRTNRNAAPSESKRVRSRSDIRKAETTFGAQRNSTITSRSAQRGGGNKVTQINRSSVNIVKDNRQEANKSAAKKQLNNAAPTAAITAAKEVASATRVIDQLEKLPKEKWTEETKKTLLRAMDVLKNNGIKKLQNLSQQTATKKQEKSPQSSQKANSNSGAIATNAEPTKVNTKKRRAAANLIERLKRMPKNEWTEQTKASLAWAKSVVAGNEIDSSQTNQPKLNDKNQSANVQDAETKTKKQRKTALHVMKNLLKIPKEKYTETQKNSFAWATRILDEKNTSKIEPKVALKRQLTQEKITTKELNVKKIRSDVHILVSVVDKNLDNGYISQEKWQTIDAKLAAIFPDILKAHPGTVPFCRNVSWYRKQGVLVACADQRSVDLFKIAIERIDKELTDAKLEVVAFDKLPLSQLRVRAWIPSESSSDSNKILEIIRTSNADLRTSNWQVARLEELEGHARSATFVLDWESLVSLALTDGIISYGFSSIVFEEEEEEEEEPSEESSADEKSAESNTLAEITTDQQAAENNDSIPEQDIEDASAETSINQTATENVDDVKVKVEDEQEAASGVTKATETITIADD